MQADAGRGGVRLEAEDRGNRPGESVEGYGSVWAAVADILRGLSDVQLRTILTTRLTPVIYVFLIFSVASANLYLTIQAFEHSKIFGFIWMLLIMPLLFIAGVIAVRVGLEVILCIFRIVMNMEALGEQLHTLRGQTETIVEDLPRIQFWRSRKRGAAPGKANPP